MGMKSRERFSKQLVRALMVMQALYAGQQTVAGVYRAVNGKWCLRTIRRDLESLVAIGFCSCEEHRYIDSGPSQVG